jgi:hypothetical protein
VLPALDSGVRDAGFVVVLDVDPVPEGPGVGAGCRDAAARPGRGGGVERPDTLEKSRAGAAAMAAA